MSRILNGDIKIQYDNRANYRICCGDRAGEWAAYYMIARLDNMVAFSGYFNELAGCVYVKYDGTVTIEKSILL